MLVTPKHGSPAGFEPEVDLKEILARDDVLVLASVASPIEGWLVDDWLGQQKHAAPDSRIDVLRVPRGEPQPAARRGGCGRGPIEQQQGSDDRARESAVETWWLDWAVDVVRDVGRP